MAAFDFPVQANPSGSVEFNTRVAQFGDGYSQAAANGINNKVDQWDIEIKGYLNAEGNGCMAKMSDVFDFFNGLKGSDSFDWVAPDGVQRKYVAQNYTRSLEANIWTVNVTFTEVFR